MPVVIHVLMCVYYPLEGVMRSKRRCVLEKKQPYSGDEWCSGPDTEEDEDKPHTATHRKSACLHRVKYLQVAVVLCCTVLVNNDFIVSTTVHMNYMLKNVSIKRTNLGYKLSIAVFGSYTHI